uniref:NADH dehydrogenase subunit 6 n=1 Tax=Apachyus feae TaxID=2914707 RepID=UPI001EFA04AA|nr:NADH dehydrogenase subunit 6 [Apachyus feae]UKE80571.1 NADH dehydrogenase subunit 6 [Apachyus feae]
MSTIILFSLTVYTTLAFIAASHPLSLGLILATQTLLIAMLLGVLNSFFWFSYILFLVYIGGILVLFMYMASLASNELFSFPITNIILSAPLILLMWFLSETYSIYTEFLKPLLTQVPALTTEFMGSLEKMYSSPSFVLTLMLAFYLLTALVAVVKISALSEGPLRSNYVQIIDKNSPPNQNR